MEKLREWIVKYREQLAYLFFGGVTTLVNIACYAGLHMGLGMPSDPANAIALALAIAVAYVTNRTWVFRSRARGRAMVRELLAFLWGRALTGLMDQGIMHLATQVIGPRYIPAPSRNLWDLGAKVCSNVLVIVLNYIFSKVFIFKKGSRQ